MSDVDNVKENFENVNNNFEHDVDMAKLKEELNAYKGEGTIWCVAPEISNSAGNLALHLVGNLKHFIGATFIKILHRLEHPAPAAFFEGHKLDDSFDGCLRLLFILNSF